MPTSKREPPTAAEMKWAGRVWDASLGRDCEALYWLSAGYPDAAQQFAALMWEQLGAAIQEEIAVNLLRFEQELLKAHRG
jgi:hypothetical protein